MTQSAALLLPELHTSFSQFGIFFFLKLETSLVYIVEAEKADH